MKTLEQIFVPDRPIADIITDLKYYKDKVMTLPKWEELKKEYEPKLHRIIPKVKRLDKFSLRITGQTCNLITNSGHGSLQPFCYINLILEVLASIFFGIVGHLLHFLFRLPFAVSFSATLPMLFQVLTV